MNRYLTALLLALSLALAASTAHADETAGPFAHGPIPHRSFPHGAVVLYYPTMTNADVDREWGFDESDPTQAPAPMFHEQTQDNLGRRYGWLEEAGYTTKPLTFVVWRNTYTTSQQAAYAAGDFGLTLMTMGAHQDTTPSPMTHPASVLTLWTYRGSDRVYVFVAYWRAHVEVEAAAMATRKPGAIRRLVPIVEQLARVAMKSAGT